jgi:hypothetical protein
MSLITPFAFGSIEMSTLLLDAVTLNTSGSFLKRKIFLRKKLSQLHPIQKLKPKTAQ